MSNRLIAVTGATGHLGQLTISAMLEHGVPPQEIVALVRDPAKAEALTAQGVQVRQADYTQPQTLDAALKGVSHLLLISSSDFNDRVGQHRNVVDAAARAGVKLLAYTSLLRADTSAMILAGDHKATEELIRASGLPFVFLRNGWYLENYTPAQAAQLGVIAGSAGEGRVSAAARADYAAAAATVLSQPGHENAVYELGGDQAFTLAELAAEVQAQTGRPVSYQDMPQQAYAEMLRGVGLPAALADVLADSDAHLAQGELYTDRHDLSRLISRPTTTLAESVRAALA
ncbi:SDR family oxidoreductase [Deinococcus humi]|uniref:NAD(P)H dehydrogenase (Quinone) n=1 Tax=Deinococcus humi TaxID=662880 RepID=A0A7W8NFK1_9DEIO|nr:SDR family oxidoreductase [Deinococcus humi]MBB5362848.1 NAD(P)H dehydrogenase (quinone) [Deinococcus humi]GGO25984.1 NAD(P)-dependent oxidoreductase [Deinococcus humi]